MSSWANLKSVTLKKREIPIRSYFETISDNYVSSHLNFLYGFIYSQKNAEPYYIRDSQGYFEPLLKPNPILHYIKESPTAGKNLANALQEMAPIVNTTSLSSLRRTATTVSEYNPQTLSKIDSFLLTTSLSKDVFDVGIVLDISGCVPAVIKSVKDLQSRVGKKSLRIFVMTDSMVLLQEFAKKGDASWTYASLMRFNAPTDKESKMMKLLSELTIMRKQEYLVLRVSSDLGKLLYITNPKIVMESQVVSFDGSTWKAIS